MKSYLMSSIVAVAACAGTATTTTQVDAPAVPEVPAVRVALMVRLEAKPEHAQSVAKLLSDGLAFVEEEPGTPYWFALQLGPTSFGIFDAFGDDQARQTHLGGKLAAALMATAPEVLSAAPVIQQVEVIGTKHAFATPCRELSKGLVVRIDAKPEHAANVSALLMSGPSVVAAEPGTPVWFGVKIDSDSFAIFDAFKTEQDRDAHLAGDLAKALGANASLLATAPTIEPADLIASKIP